MGLWVSGLGGGTGSLSAMWLGVRPKRTIYPALNYDSSINKKKLPLLKMWVRKEGSS